jgi:hypothetical protein
MASTPDLNSCLELGPNQEASALPVNPFLAVRYQFGMLLGADDFDTAEGYPRGKMRLHNAWLHGAGVVWGFDVQAPQVSPPTDPSLTGELLVKAGLALDDAGHELYLDQDACVDVGAWYAKHKDEQAVKDVAQVDPASGVVTLPLHVELAFAACLARQVPAMSEPCDGATGTSTAYSRARELVRLSLLPGPAAARADAYPTLRYLFKLGPPPAAPTPHQADAVAAVDAGFTSPGELLALLRRCAVADETAMGAATVPPLGKRSYFPTAADAPALPLANLTGVTLTPQPGGQYRMTAANVDVNVRPAHVATSTIQELHCCAGDAGTQGGGTQGGGTPSASATLTTESLCQVISVRSLQLAFEEPTLAHGFSVTQLSGAGWEDVAITQIALDPADASRRSVRLVLRDGPPAGSLLRMVARGTGPTPLLCRDAGGKRVPFRGDRGRGDAFDGSDFVTMWEVQ